MSSREEIKYVSSPELAKVVVYVIKKYFSEENCRTR